MELKEKIKIHLDQIKTLKGVENVVLTQRDGNPIQSTGVWFSKDEVFNVSTAASAIYNVGIHMYPDDLKYILIEGKKAKILIAPLTNTLHRSLNEILKDQGIIDCNHEYFIAITAHPSVNLGGIFLQTNECLRKIKTSLIASGESFKPPLIQYDNNNTEKIFDGFNLKEDTEYVVNLTPFSISFSETLAQDLKKVLREASLSITSFDYAFVSIEGGFVASKFIKSANAQTKTLDDISAMSYSLFETANRCAWLLKKMKSDQILIECDNSYQFINGLGKAIFSTKVGKSRQKLGLLRLYLPQYSTKVNKILNKSHDIEDQFLLDPKKLLGELIIK